VGPDLPQESMFCPSSVTSLTPPATSAATSASTASLDRLCSTPRVLGTTQYVHLLHPFT
jgi:hypothetical protein